MLQFDRGLTVLRVRGSQLHVTSASRYELPRACQEMDLAGFGLLIRYEDLAAARQYIPGSEDRICRAEAVCGAVPTDGDGTPVRRDGGDSRNPLRLFSVPANGHDLESPAGDDRGGPVSRVGQQLSTADDDGPLGSGYR